MCSSLPTRSKLHAEVYAASKAISNRFLPSTSAYHEVITSVVFTNPIPRSGYETAMAKTHRLREMQYRILSPCTGRLIYLESDDAFQLSTDQ